MTKRSKTTLGVATLTAILANLYVDWPAGWEYPYNRSKPLQLTPNQSAQIASNPGPDLRQMAALMSQRDVLLTPEQKTEEKRVIQGQIEHALQLLHSHTPKDRQIGVEQLSAYQTAETEKALRVSLEKDSSETVRAAAATSLGKFKYPSAATFEALIAALRDPQERVRSAALKSLMETLRGGGNRIATPKRILDKISKAAQSPKIDPKLALSLRGLLADRQ